MSLVGRWLCDFLARYSAGHYPCAPDIVRAGYGSECGGKEEWFNSKLRLCFRVCMCLCACM